MTNSRARRKRDVSVIIPSYNSAAYLDQCLSSVIQQEEVNLEVIIVDDGSTDNTKCVLEKYKGRINYIYQDNQGPEVARNTALKQSTGAYIQFLDADDLLGKNSIIERVRFLERSNDRTIAVCRNYTFEKVLLGRFPLINGTWSLFQNNLDIHLCRLNIAPPHAFLTPRHMIDEIGYYDETLHGCEDYDYWLRALGLGYTPVYCKEGHVFYRRHRESKGSIKATKGMYTYDIILAKRKDSGEYGGTVQQILHTLEGMLAFCDGLLTKVIAIDANSNPTGRNEMVQLATQYLAQINKSLPEDYIDLSEVAKLQYCRILSKWQKIQGLGNKLLSDQFLSLKSRYKTSIILKNNINKLRSLNTYEGQQLYYSTARILISA
jgi:glycosyltransferase involved in cell wall biosynthesis